MRICKYLRRGSRAVRAGERISSRADRPGGRRQVSRAVRPEGTTICNYRNYRKYHKKAKLAKIFQNYKSTDEFSVDQLTDKVSERKIAD